MTVLEPRERSRFANLLLVAMLMILNGVSVYNILGFNRAADKTEESAAEQRCRAEVTNEAVAVILGQQVLITTGLSQAVAEAEPFNPEEFVRRADTLGSDATKVVRKLETVVDDCQPDE